jgi:hypothetical protein
VNSLRELPRSLQRVPETVAEMTRRFPEAAAGLSDAVSTALGDRISGEGEDKGIRH